MNRSLLLYSHSTTIFLRFIASSTRRYGLITNCREGPFLIPTGYNQHRRPHSRGMHHAIRVRLRGLSEVGKRQRMKGRLMKYYQRVYSHMMGGNVRERRCVKGS